jgi:hypothetical protein
LKWVKILLIVAVSGIAAFAVCIVAAWRLLGISGSVPAGGAVPAAANLFSTTDTVTIWLSVLSVMIALSSLIVTGSGLLVGALAIIGYQTFRDEVTRRVNEEVIAQTKKFFGGQVFKSELKGQVKQHLSPQTWESGTVSGKSPLPIDPIRVRAYPKKKQKDESDAETSIGNPPID